MIVRIVVGVSGQIIATSHSLGPPSLFDGQNFGCFPLVECNADSMPKLTKSFSFLTVNHHLGCFLPQGCQFFVKKNTCFFFSFRFSFAPKGKRENPTLFQTH